MQREFEIFSKPAAPAVAVKRGFSWPGFVLSWIWALTRGLWWQAGGILVVGTAITLLNVFVFAGSPAFAVLLGVTLQFFVGLKGNAWRSRKLEREGYRFAGTVVVSSPAAAVSAHSLGRA